MLLNPKPTIKFDPSNKDHREVIRGFMTTGRMQADYKFRHDAKYISLHDQCMTELVVYFLNKEPAKKQKETV